MNDISSLNIAPMPVKLRIDDYLALDDMGAFADYAKTELIEGEILYMNAQHRPHARVKMDIYDALRDALRGAGLKLRPLVEASIAIPDHSVPEPDIVLTSDPDGEGLIPLSSVALIVEISDATVKNDLGRKARLYAKAGVAEYWVADIPDHTLHQFWLPSGGVYAEQKPHSFGSRLAAATLPIAIDLPE